MIQDNKDKQTRTTPCIICNGTGEEWDGDDVRDCPACTGTGRDPHGDNDAALKEMQP